MSLTLRRRVGEKENDNELENRIKKTIMTELPNFKLNDVCGLKNEKLTLMTPILSKKRYFNRFLLFGPRGTGKTHLAKSLAGEALAKRGKKPFKFFSVSSSDLRSKRCGESEKLIKHLFSLAKLESPSIIFLDDLDMLFDVYTDDEWMRRVKTAFRLQLDLMEYYKEKVIFIAAASALDNLDDSLLRGFEQLIYIPLPDEELRGEMFRKHLSRKKADITRDDVLRFAQLTNGFSSEEIAEVCQAAHNKKDVIDWINILATMLRTSSAEVKEFNKFAKERAGWNDTPEDSHKFTFSDAVAYCIVGIFV